VSGPSGSAKISFPLTSLKAGQISPDHYFELLEKQ
jgi:hypothetical protein